MKKIDEMSAGELVVPKDMATPSEVELKASGVDPLKIGIWASKKICQGAKFGPFEGNKVQQPSDNMDSAFVWEIVDQDTKQFLFYIDATDANVGNWMKYIGCARFFEEQNIVSQQEGTEIFYKAIKDIEPGDELLTWYEKIPMRKKRGRKKKVPEDSSSRSSTPTLDLYSKKYKPNPKRKTTEDVDSDDEQAKRPKRTQKKLTKYSEFTDSEYISDGYISASSGELRAKSVSPVLKKKKISPMANDKKTSKSKENSDVEDDDKTLPEDDEDEVFEDDDLDSLSVCSSSLKLDHEGGSQGAASRTSSTAEPDKYQFDLKSHHVVKSRLGRKVFKCDICMAVYRHAFSLKRHYIRNHINYNYVTKGDLQNCQITSEALETLAMAMALQKKQKEQVELVKQATSSEDSGTTNVSSLNSETTTPSENEPKAQNDSGESEKNISQNHELLPSPGKDENRNKIAETSEAAGGDEENEQSVSKSNASDGRVNDQDNKTAQTPKAEQDGFCTSDTKSSELHTVAKPHETNNDGRPHTKEEQTTANNKSINCDNGENEVSQLKISDVDDEESSKKIEKESEVSPQKESQAETCKDQGADPEGIDNTDKGTLVENNDSTETKSDEAAFAALFRCNVCNFCFDTIKQLKSHIEDHPDMPNMKAFGCDKCDMRFSHKQNLVRHQAVHTGAKPFTCRYCGKNFPTVTNQKRHERIHLGRRVQCEYCASSFTQSGDLRKHTRKLHPEHFHECAFCAKYYSSQKELIAHLDTHNENFASNKDEENRRRQEFRVDMEKDREESMRLAECKPGYKFACTVCKKRFHDYANMCRHRRLAHQRHLLISKKVRLCNNIDGQIDGNKSISDSLLFDLEPNPYFYNNVARNISENLKYFVEGGVNDLQNNAAYIRWKSEEHNVQSFASETTRKQTLVSPEENGEEKPRDEVFTKYNFPEGFRLMENYTELLGGYSLKRRDEEIQANEQMFIDCRNTEQEVSPKPAPMLRAKPLILPPAPKPHPSFPNGMFRPYSGLQDPAHIPPPAEPGKRTFDAFQISSGTVSQLQALPEPQQAPYNFSTKPDNVSVEDPLCECEPGKTVLPIKTPSVKICAVCRSIFSNEKMYEKHMLDKHKITVESSPTSLKENVPILPACNVPPVHSEVTISSSNISPPRLGINFVPKSPRTYLNVPQVFKSSTSRSFNVFKNGNKTSEVDSHSPGAIDLSHSASHNNTSSSHSSGNVPSDLDLTQSGELFTPISRDFINLTCRENVTESPKSKATKSPKTKSKSVANRVVLQTPKIVPRFESPFHKAGGHSGNKANRNSSLTNGITVPFFTSPVLDLTKNADPSGLGNYQERDPCLEAGAVDYSTKQKPQETSSACAEIIQMETPATARDSVASPPEQTSKMWSYRPSHNPNPVGLLNVCTSQVPSQTDKMRYSCTKCSKKFSVISSLHAHILDCASEGKKKADTSEKAHTKYVFKKGLGRISIQSKKMPSASQMKLKAAIGFQKKMFMGKMKSSAYFTGKDEEYYNGDAAASKRRKSLELMYNPQNHMRRRELTEVLDMHRCHGCGLRFGTISLLERHIRVCKHKEKIKEMHSVKTTVASRRIHKRPKDTFVRDTHKQKCRYCDKLFTYIGMLKKHVLDICPVRREYFEHGNADHIDKVWEDTIICVGGSLIASSNSCNMNTKESFAPDNMSDVSEDSKAGRKRKGRGRRKNRKWGNQNKTRRKSPDNVKIGNCSFDDGQTPPKSPESGNNENSIKEEDDDSDDTESGAKCEIIYKQDENEWPKDSDETGTEVEEMAAESHVRDNGPNVVGSVDTKETRRCEEISTACDNEEEVKLEPGKDRKENETDSSEVPEIYTKENSETELSTNVPDLNTNNRVKSLPLDLKPDGVPMTVTTTAKPLFDLDSTIARLKERTNVMNKDEKESAQQNLESTTSTDKIQKKGWKKTKTRELDEPSKLKRTKQLKPIESSENTEKSSQKEQKRSESRDSQKNVTPKKDMNGETTLTKAPNGSQIIPIVKSGVKRGRKPKAAVKKSSTIGTLNKRNMKLSENSVLLGKNPIGEGENLFENSTEKSMSKKSPKGQGKNIKRNKIDDINVIQVVNKTSSAEREALKEEGSVKKSRKGGRKKQNDLENNLFNQQESKQLKCPDENIPNGIQEEKEPSPVKGKRGPKKRKVIDHSDADQFDSKITPKNKKSPRIKTTEQNRNISGNSNEELATSPPKRAKKSVIKEPTSAANDGGKVSPKLNGTGKKIKIGSQKGKSAKDTNDLLVPDNTSMRASSRSTSRSTSRSRSRSVQREITPPPTAKKAKSVSSVQGAKRQVEARTKKSSNRKANKVKAKQPVVKGNNTATGTRKSVVTNNAKNTPFKGRGRTNNNR